MSTSTNAISRRTVHLTRLAISRRAVPALRRLRGRPTKERLSPLPTGRPRLTPGRSHKRAKSLRLAARGAIDGPVSVPRRPRLRGKIVFDCDPNAPELPCSRVQETIHRPPLSARQWLGWLGVSIVTLGMYVYGIAHEPLWLDETYSFAMVQHGFVDIVKLTTRDVHPPLYYLFLKLCTLLFGTSPVALRLPSVFAALGLLVLAMFPVRRLFGDRTAYSFALLVAMSPGFVCFAQETRMYTLTAFLVTSAVVYGRLALRLTTTEKGQKAAILWFGLFTWAAAMSHYFALVAVAVNGLYVVVTAYVKYRQRWKSLALAMLTAALLYSPWLVPMGFQVAAVSRGFWIPPMNLKLFTYALVAPFTYKFEDVACPWQAWVAFALVALVLLGSLVVKRWRGKDATRSARVQLLTVYIATFAFGLVFSSLVQPILMPRYLMVCAGVFLLATASGLDAITSRSSTTLFALLTGVLLGFGLPASLRIQREHFNGPFHALAARVDAMAPLDGAERRAPKGLEPQVLVHVDGQTLFPAWHILPNARHVMLLDKGASFDVSESGVYDTARLSATRDLTATLAQTNHVWLVDMDPTGFHLDPARILAHPGWGQLGPAISLDLPMSWVKVRLSYFERRP
jgi:hypothetical protein